MEIKYNYKTWKIYIQHMPTNEQMPNKDHNRPKFSMIKTKYNFIFENQKMPDIYNNSTKYPTKEEMNETYY